MLGIVHESVQNAYLSTPSSPDAEFPSDAFVQQSDKAAVEIVESAADGWTSRKAAAPMPSSPKGAPHTKQVAPRGPACCLQCIIAAHSSLSPTRRGSSLSHQRGHVDDIMFA